MAKLGKQENAKLKPAKDDRRGVNRIGMQQWVRLVCNRPKLAKLVP